MNTKLLFKDAPKFIIARFRGVNKYVWKTLFPENTLNKRLQKLENKELSRKELIRIKDIVSEASVVVFIFFIKKFLVEGTTAAKQAVDTFQDLGIQGFQIGSKYFSERNENVMLGENLSIALMESISDKDLTNLINESKSVNEIMDRYKRIIR